MCCYTLLSLATAALFFAAREFNFILMLAFTRAQNTKKRFTSAAQQRAAQRMCERSITSTAVYWSMATMLPMHSRCSYPSWAIGRLCVFVCSYDDCWMKWLLTDSWQDGSSWPTLCWVWRSKPWTKFTAARRHAHRERKNYSPQST